MKRIKLFLLSLMAMFIGVAVSSCSNEDNEDNGSLSGGTEAWRGYYEEGGYWAEVVITLDGATNGMYRRFLNGYSNYERISFGYFTMDGTINADIEGDDFKITILDGNSAILTSGSEAWSLSKINLMTYWTEIYADHADYIKDIFEDYKAGGHHSLISLISVTQEELKKIRQYASYDGVYIDASEWETKTVSEGGYSQSGYNTWLNKYKTQEQEVIRCYDKYLSADRFGKISAKSDFTWAQTELKIIRGQAEQDGHILPKSEWESKKL